MRNLYLFIIFFCFAISGKSQADFGIYFHKNFALNKSEVFPCPQKTNGEHFGIDFQYPINRLTILSRIGFARYEKEGYQYFPAAWFSSYIWGQKDTYNMEHSVGIRYSFLNKNKWEFFGQLNADSNIRLTSFCGQDSDCIEILQSDAVYNFQAEVIAGLLYNLTKKWQAMASIGMVKNFQSCSKALEPDWQLGLNLRYSLTN